MTKRCMANFDRLVKYTEAGIKSIVGKEPDDNYIIKRFKLNRTYWCDICIEKDTPCSGDLTYYILREVKLDKDNKELHAIDQTHIGYINYLDYNPAKYNVTEVLTLLNMYC